MATTTVRKAMGRVGISQSASILTVAAGDHGVLYTSSTFNVVTLKELTVMFTPALTVTGGTPDTYSYCQVFVIDDFGNNFLLGTLTHAVPLRTFSAVIGAGFGATINVQVFPGVGQATTNFALDVQGKA